MEPRLFDAHCHLDLMAHPDAVADEATALGLGLFDCGVDHATSLTHMDEPVALLPSSRASASIPGGSPTSDAATQKLTYSAKLPRKNVLLARSGSTFPLVLPEVSRYKYRHLTGSAIHSCSALLPGA